MWKVITQELFEPTFISFHPVVLKKKTFKNFFFSINQKSWLLSWKTGKVIRHNFGRGIFPKDLLEKGLKCKKVTFNRCQVIRKAHSSLWFWCQAKYIIITNYYIFLVVSQPQSKYTCIVLIIYFELQESDLYCI